MRRILLISLFLGALVSLQAQAPIRFSVQLSPQFAWFSSDDNAVKPAGSIGHIQAGIQMDYFFAENYAFAVGLGINNLGGNLQYADSTEFSSKGDILLVEPGQTVKHNVQYIDIPVGLKLKTEELGYATFFFQLGFNPMININAKASSNDAGLDKEDIKESTYPFSLGYHAEAGAEYKLGGSTSLVGGIRWSAGLTDVTKDDGANVKSRAIVIHLGVLF